MVQKPLLATRALSQEPACQDAYMELSTALSDKDPYPCALTRASVP